MLVDTQESRFTEPRKECPKPSNWHSEDEQATETEVIELAYGLIRGLQPGYVLETGTHRGFMAARIADALRENGHGHLDTVEKDSELCEEASARVYGDVCEVHNCHSLDFEPSAPIDFAWFDTDGGTRVKEFEKFYRHMHDRTVVCFHDTGVHHFIVKNHVLNLAKKGMLVPVFLPTPRGVAICQVFKEK